MLLALLSSVLWGIADFAGGSVSRRMPAFTVVLASQAAGLLAAAIAAAALGEWSAPPGYLPWAAGAGLVGAAGLLAFYRALAVGTMGVVSPIAALGVVVPVAVGFLTGRWPPLVVGLGIAAGVGGVVLASGPERSAGRSLRPVLLGAVAAVCFGSTLLLIARGAAHSAVMTMVAMRATSVVALAAIAVVRRYRVGRERPAFARPRPTGRSAGIWGVVVITGLFDVGANLTFAVASTAGALAIVAILGSLYPAVTVLLARVIHAERLARIQLGGVALALLGVALIAGWS